MLLEIEFHILPLPLNGLQDLVEKPHVSAATMSEERKAEEIALL